MEDNREFKHVCKLCNRRFACGRSLGGHMRSHLIKTQTETGENLKKMNWKRDGSNSADMDKFPGAGVSDAYGLRKNPKKTSRLDEFSDEEKFCRECGKSFQSWKALFGHMKCHSTQTERVSSNLEFDSQSDDENAVANRGYMAADETSSSFSYAAAAVSSSVSDQNNQEQEEIALCLMMLSRDVGGFHSTTEESSDTNSMPKQVPSLVPKGNFSKAAKGIPSLCMRSEMENLKEFHSRKLELSEIDSGYLKFKGSNLEFSASIVKMNKMNEKSHQDDRHGSSSNNQTKFNPPQFISSKFNSDQIELPNGKFTPNSLRRLQHKELNSETYRIREKRRQFQCNLCYKMFHSYQALGGHRASHKKNKGCIDSKTKNSENSIETEISNDLIFEMENQQESDIEIGYETKKKKQHQCSICYKFFKSGQALGGHKRSHLVSRLKSRNKLAQTTAIKKPEPEIREYLDLNLPAPIDDEGSSHLGSIEPWWEQPLVGFI